jgi:hypothetical protein
MPRDLDGYEPDGGKLSRRPWVVGLIVALFVALVLSILGSYLVSQHHIDAVVSSTSQQTAAIQGDTKALTKLLTTDHAVTAKRDEQLSTLLTETHTLLTDGKSQASLNAKAAAASAKAGTAIITHVEQLITAGDVRGDQNHALICIIAELIPHPTVALSNVISKDCTGIIP